MEAKLKQMPNANLRVLVVWEPILLTDWGRPGSAALARISDPRVVQFWDRRHLIAQELRRRILASPARISSWDGPLSSEILWDAVAVYPPKVAWSNAGSPAFFDGPVYGVTERVKKNLLDLAQ